jgi:hypothetical protein
MSNAGFAVDDQSVQGDVFGKLIMTKVA